MNRLATFALGLLMLGAPLPLRADDAADAGHRRALTFRIANSDAPGDNMAVADFYVDASHKPDGSDLRVLNAAGGLVPMQVLHVSALDDRVRIAFATKTDGPYSVTWGNKPDKPSPPLIPKRGVFAEVYRLPAGAVVRTPEMIEQMFAKAGPRLTASFVNELSVGFIPAGPQDDAMVRYTSQFKVDKAGDYDIALAVGKAGYVGIDGTAVLNDFGGRMIRDARNSKTITLTAGWHALVAAQINRATGETGIEVAWRKAGDTTQKFATIPNSAPAAKALDGPIEPLKPGPEADFTIEPQAEGFFTPDTYCPRYAFEARPAGVLASQKLTFAWDFGDGQTSSVRRTNHYFLAPGVYPVTLTLQAGTTTYKATRRVQIGERLIDLFPTPPEDLPKVIDGVVDLYAPDKLNAASSLRGTMYYEKELREPQYLAWGKAWLQKKDAQDAQTVNDEAIALSHTWLEKGEADMAAQALELASQKDIGLDHQSRLMHRAVVMYAGEAGEPDKTATLANSWTDRVSTAAKPVILAAQAYAAIAKGDGKRAKDLCKLGTSGNLPLNKQQINQGVMTRNVEAYIRTKEYEEAAKILDDWEIDYPDALTEGYSRLLRVKLLVAQGRPQTAFRIALDHARALPDSFYAAELLYRAAEASKAANRPADAKTAMDLLKSKYPESPYANGKPPGTP